MKNITVCDTHCDTASEALDRSCELYKNSLMLDFERMREYKGYTQFFAAFTAPEYYDKPFERCSSIIKYILSQVEKYSDMVKLCKCFEDIKLADQENKLSVFISAEGGEGVKSIEALERLYAMGVRMLTLTWNNDNLLGGGAFGDGGGLTALGKEVVKKMNSLGMVVDVSHASEKTFYDIMSITSKPVAASHSNAYELCPHPRNLKKEQIKELISTNSFIGINFYSEFLAKNRAANIDDIIRNIEYFLSLGGKDNIGLGSDFDGIDLLPEGIKDVSDTYNIFSKLSQKELDDEIIQNIAYKNIYRLLSICL